MKSEFDTSVSAAVAIRNILIVPVIIMIIWFAVHISGTGEIVISIFCGFIAVVMVCMIGVTTTQHRRD